MNDTSHAKDLTLDIGCGSTPRGSINVDARRLDGVDVVCSALHLPFADSSFSKVLLSPVRALGYLDSELPISESAQGMAAGCSKG